MIAAKWILFRVYNRRKWLVEYIWNPSTETYQCSKVIINGIHVQM